MWLNGFKFGLTVGAFTDAINFVAGGVGGFVGTGVCGAAIRTERNSETVFHDGKPVEVEELLG